MFSKRLSAWTLILLVCIFGSAWADQEHPKANPQAVIVKGRNVSHYWKNGRILVPPGELIPLLSLPHSDKDLDLLEQLELDGRYIWSFQDGVFEARQDPAKFASPSGVKRAPTPSYYYPSSSSGSGQSRASSPGSSSGGTVNVSGYYRKNGTYVRPHVRSAPTKR